jgi:hypothetical protein
MMRASPIGERDRAVFLAAPDQTSPEEQQMRTRSRAMKRRQRSRWATTLAASLTLAAGIGLAVPQAAGYERYNDGCHYCHGHFFDGASPRGSVFPANSKHEMHKNQGFIGAACTLCHGGPDNGADWLAASGGTDVNPGVGCVGCHGRAYDGIGDSGVGLRAAHNGLCVGCHPDDPAPLPENVLPTYYGTEDTNILDPCNLPPDYTESNTYNDLTGLDNDGDGYYDGDDPDCQDVPTFDTSLHATRAGKNYWYGEATGGFEQFTNVPIEDLGCVQCHGPTDANGDPYPPDYEPSCADCHATESAWEVSQDQCLSCHGRQNTLINVLGYTDVHRTMGFECWDCHTVDDMHGDGTEYESMLQPGAVDADCEDCHDTLPPEHSDYDPHGGDLHCSACHEQTVVSCYNCHFESQVEEHIKRAKQPLHDFVILANREKDGKVGTMSFQSLTYQGDSFVAFAPFTGHTITDQGRTCTDCHVNLGGENEAIEQYNATGQIKFASWDDENKVLSWIHGVIPMPEDYQDTFRMDFLTYTGDPSDPPPGDPNLWTGIGEDTWDGSQMFFATPLTRDQMDALGFEAICVADLNSDDVVDVFDLLQLLGAWGESGVPEDLNGDGFVDVFDLLELLAAWGQCP